MKGYFEMSKVVEDLKEEVGKVIEEGNEKFSKGTKLEKWEIKEDKIIFEIDSSELPRPHEFVVRLKKLLAERLGRKFRVGVRDIRVEFYEIEFELERKP